MNPIAQQLITWTLTTLAGGGAGYALKARAQAIYDTYSSLGGNGHGT